MTSYTIYPLEDLTPVSTQSTPEALGARFGALPNEILEVIFENIANTNQEYGMGDWVVPAREFLHPSRVCRTFHNLSLSCLIKIHYKITNQINNQITY